MLSSEETQDLLATVKTAAEYNKALEDVQLKVTVLACESFIAVLFAGCSRVRL